jgi:hypothetical protein
LKPQIPNAQLATTQISVINESTVLTDTDVTPVVIALQQQVTNDFRPIWGTDAELKMIPQGTPAPAGTWQLVILDDSDQAGALGYHDLTPDGLPLKRKGTRTTSRKRRAKRFTGPPEPSDIDEYAGRMLSPM